MDQSRSIPTRRGIVLSFKGLISGVKTVSGLAIAAVFVPFSSVASPLLGEWCSPEYGAVLYVEPDSLGIGENGICDYADPPGAASMVSTQIDCVNMYYNEDQVIAANPRSHALFLEILEEDKLLMRLDEDPYEELERCAP